MSFEKDLERLEQIAAALDRADLTLDESLALFEEAVASAREDAAVVAFQERLAHRATVAAIRTSLQLYFGLHGGYPPSKEVVGTLLNPPPAFEPV